MSNTSPEGAQIHEKPPTTALTTNLNIESGTVEELDQSILKLAQSLNNDSSINKVHLLLTYVGLRKCKFGKNLPAELRQAVEAGIKGPVDLVMAHTMRAWEKLDTATIKNLAVKIQQTREAFIAGLVAAGKNIPLEEHANKKEEMLADFAAGKTSLLNQAEGEAWDNYGRIEMLIDAGAAEFHIGIRTIKDLDDNFNYAAFIQRMRDLRASQQAQAVAAQMKAMPANKDRSPAPEPQPSKASPSVLAGLFHNRFVRVAAAIGSAVTAVFAGSSFVEYFKTPSQHSEISSDFTPEKYDRSGHPGDSDFIASIDLDQPTESEMMTKVEEVEEEQPKKEAKAPKAPEKHFGGDYTIRPGEGVLHGINSFLRNPDLRHKIFAGLTKDPHSPVIARIRARLERIGRMDQFETSVLHHFAMSQSGKFDELMMFSGYTVGVVCGQNDDFPKIEVRDVSGKPILEETPEPASPAKIHQEKTPILPSTPSSQLLSSVQGVIQGLKGSLDLSMFDKQPITTGVNSTNFDLRSKRLRLVPPAPANIIPPANSQNVSLFGPTSPTTGTAIKKNNNSPGVINIARIMDTGDQIRNVESQLAPLLQTLSQKPYKFEFHRDNRGCLRLKEGFFGFGGKTEKWKELRQKGDPTVVKAAELLDDAEDLRVNG